MAFSGKKRGKHKEMFWKVYRLKDFNKLCKVLQKTLSSEIEHSSALQQNYSFTYISEEW